MAIVYSELLPAFHLGPDLSRFKSIEWHFALNCLPEKRAECKHINFLVILPLLEQLWCHVARSSRKLHRPSAEVSLEQMVNFKSLTGTYNESGEAEVAHLDVIVIVDEHIVTLDIPMHDAQVVHVEINSCAVKGNPHTLA